MNFKWLTIKNVVCVLLLLLIVMFLPQVMGIFLLFYSAFVVTSSLEPFIERLQKYMGRKPAATIAVLAFMVLTFITFIPILVASVNEIISFGESLPNNINAATNFIATKSVFGYKLADLIDLQDIMASMGGIAQNIVNKSIDLTMNLAQICVFLVVFTMIVFYFAIDKEYLEKKFVEFFPPDMKTTAKNILDTIALKVGAYVRTQVLSMISVGVMVMIGLAILNIKYSFLLGLISGVLDIVPIVGPTIALVAIILVAYSAGWLKVILAVAVFLIVQQLSNYVVRPFLFGRFMSLHPLTLFLALFIAQQFFGVVGVILSPAIASTICVLVDELYLKKINDEEPELIENGN